MSRRENVDIHALQTLINDLSNFSDSVQSILNDISNDVAELNSYWDDLNYQRFQSYMSNLISITISNIKKIDGTESALREMYTIMTT